ncbi:hypothetical protein ACH5RR_021400 [Cinchona calisaya]|uniref:Uncharacterized protein n=1 Tax=Cinchona calisaya TaxID=153742 RepID=A0ABD2ZH65_9GENT
MLNPYFLSLFSPLYKSSPPLHNKSKNPQNTTSYNLLPSILTSNLHQEGVFTLQEGIQDFEGVVKSQFPPDLGPTAVSFVQRDKPSLVYAILEGKTVDIGRIIYQGF